MERRRGLQFTQAMSQHLGARGLLPQAPVQQSPFPDPAAENLRGQLAEDYSLIPSRSHPRLQNVVPGRGGEEGPQPPHPFCLCPAALHEALQEAEWLSSARHAPLPWLQLFSSHDLGEVRAPFPRRGPLAV